MLLSEDLFWPALSGNWSWNQCVWSFWEWMFYTGCTVYAVILLLNIHRNIRCSHFVWSFVFVRSTIVFGLSVRLSVHPFVCRWSLYLSHFNRISSKFCIWNASMNLSIKFEYGFCPTSDNQDGRHNGRLLSISTVVVTLTQSFLIRFLPNFVYELPLSTSSDNQDGQQNGRHLSISTVVVTLTQSFLIAFLQNFVYGLLP